MMSTTQACQTFADDISAYVDDELESDRRTQLVEHVRHCGDCQGYVDALRQLSSLHRQATDVLDEDLAAAVDPRGLFGAITATLLDEKQGRLAGLFYELGKGYVLVGHRALGSRERQSLAVTRTRPRSLRRVESELRSERRSVDELSAVAGRPSGRSTSLFAAPRRSFDDRAAAESGVLGKGRAYLEEALALDPSRDDARLYLGLVFWLTGRADRAKRLYRQVYTRGASAEHRLMALNMIGKMYLSTRDYRRAVECYEEVADGFRGGDDPEVMAVLNLAVSYAQAGMTAEAEGRFHSLAERFPQRLPILRRALSGMSDFLDLLGRDDHLRERLRARVPALFAA